MDVYSPADNADNAEECSELHYFAEKDRLVRLMWFWVLGFRLRKSARSAGELAVHIYKNYVDEYKEQQ